MPRGMPNEHLYLHETIHIIGTGSEPYKRHTAAWAARRRHGGALVGIRLRAGAVDDYLDAVATHWQPVAEGLGLRLIGAYRTAMRDTEAVILWSVPTFADFTRHLAGARETREWTDEARAWRTDYRETLLV